ncbi:cell differentiation protein rcd1 [Salpingoeca rosetta]|uniref:Cell differentiation protein rcd1 n=1 Tax=Salpingoeca rosetta (strain ATCC 50818 / BSB-021) TaxID=946362 RepID=F2U8K3_SALR5|nr:cell differentiation protein rcd1 [Salpingoeca rosetta]EGD72711.1 cell differentiation protein rcd1 [Salpingoeca rosetta]|eukprot:XP_004994534.1 cell differentiation protein rcd1 [Salpingoeca rosetta]
MPYQKRGGGRGGGDGRQQQQKQDSQHLGDGFDQGPGPHGGHGGGGRSGGHLSEQALITLIQDIQDLRKREDAMATLSKHRDSVKKLAVLLWHSFGIIPILVDEVISVYEHLCPEEGLQCTASSPRDPHSCSAPPPVPRPAAFSLPSPMVHALAQSPSGRLLKHVVRCYHRLSDNPRARDALRSCLPDKLRDGTIENTLRSQKDEQTLAFLQKLLVNLGLASPSTVPALPTQQQQAQ